MAMLASLCVPMQRGRCTVHLVLQSFDLRVRFVDQLIHLLTECVVLFRQALCKMFLVYDLLRSLVTVESQSATCALHDDSRTESAKHRRFVVF